MVARAILFAARMIASDAKIQGRPLTGLPAWASSKTPGRAVDLTGRPPGLYTGVRRREGARTEAAALADSRDRAPGLAAEAGPGETIQEVHPILSDPAIRPKIDPFSFLQKLPWEKMAIWTVFFLCIYTLRSFFNILFLTFLLSYTGANLVSWILSKADVPLLRDRLRWLVTVIVFLLFMGLLAGTGSFVLPRLVQQLKTTITTVQGLLPVTVVKTEGGGSRVEIVKGRRPSRQPNIIDYGEMLAERVVGESRFAELRTTPEYVEARERVTSSLMEWLVQTAPSLFRRIPSIILLFLEELSDALLSILLSFIIVMQLPGLQRSLARLKESRLSKFYDEIAPDMIGFGKSIGRAFQAQALIALCNTALTFLGLVLLDVPSPLFLAVFVFVCSFIPVLGVFLSSVPICILGLQKGGFVLVLELILFVIFVHLVEAYVLNPKIMGAVMHIHFLAVLIILLVAGKLFGFWGLLLGIPTFQYLFHEVVMKKGRSAGPC